MSLVRNIWLACYAWLSLVTLRANDLPTVIPERGDTGTLAYVLYADEAESLAREADSVFFMRALPIVFPVSQTSIKGHNPELQHFIHHALPLLRAGDMQHARIRVRSASSPEGPLAFNRRLSAGRRDALLRIFDKYGVNASELQIDVVDEEYELLAFFMRQNGDPDAPLVSQLVDELGAHPAQLKKRLKKQDGGRLWKRLLQQYFPRLRASRFMIILPASSPEVLQKLGLEPLSPLPFDSIALPKLSGEESPRQPLPDLPGLPFSPVPQRWPRREMLALKTNLLEWGAYVPQYGFCPMPNIELEFYPKHGHWTVGASFDCPWWVGNTTNHKYFELRNYQLYTRFYFRNSNRSYSDGALKLPTRGEAAFRGFYLQGYLHAGLFQIGFSASKGWIGEALGGGIGAGYVLPLSRDGHWRLDFALQLGMMYAKYDPFVYGKPQPHGGEVDGLYYYDTELFRDNFEKRMHRFTWLGPTRIGVSISYDLLFRRRGGSQPSFHRWEKGDAR